MQKKTNVTAIFDIGKTNKKFFLFDTDYQEVYREYTSIVSIKDEQGHPTEDIRALRVWVEEVFGRLLGRGEYKVTALNFSTYGASFVHIDKKGEVLTPLYNYTKPLSKELIGDFFADYGPQTEFAKATGSSDIGMLTSGMQLYWLKRSKPEIFKKIAASLHLPQYLSYIFTGKIVSEYTSIGCHTGLWDYTKKDYHDWVYAENIDSVLPSIVSSDTTFEIRYNEKRIHVGVGMHDSSAALLPYVQSIKKKFILVSTGTWSIALNPFPEKYLTYKNLEEQGINYMRVDGNPVKPNRLFLGNEYAFQVRQLADRFKLSNDYHKSVFFDYPTFFDIIKDFTYCFRWQGIVDTNMPEKTTYRWDCFKYAYHQLMVELVLLQVISIKSVIGDDTIKKLYIDGGFSDNDIYTKLLTFYLDNMELLTARAPIGSALGAAIAVSGSELGPNFLKTNYALKKHLSFSTE